MAGALVFVLLALAMAGLFVLGWRVGRAPRRDALTAAGLGLALLVAKSALHHKPTWEAAVFPWLSYAYVQDAWLWLLAQFFFGMAIPQLPVRWNRAVIGALAAWLFGWGLWAQRWLVVSYATGEERSADERHHYAQSTGHTCVPSSCVIVLSYWGIAATELEMAELCLTKPEWGTTSFNAYRGLSFKTDGLPFRCRIVSRTVDTLPPDGTPLLWTDAVHARVLLRVGDRFIVHDPLDRAPTEWTRARVAELLEGPVVLLEATDGRRPAPAAEPEKRRR